jgi:hypothetical protein
MCGPWKYAIFQGFRRVSVMAYYLRYRSPCVGFAWHILSVLVSIVIKMTIPATAIVIQNYDIVISIAVHLCFSIYLVIAFNR